MKIAIAGIAVALIAAGGGVAQAGPGDAEGCVAVANPQIPLPYSCSYVAKVDGLYSNEGDWTLVIKRGCNAKATKCKQTITIKNPSTPGGHGYAGPGVIKPGDRVTGTMRTLGSVLTFGNATGV